MPPRLGSASASSAAAAPSAPAPAGAAASTTSTSCAAHMLKGASSDGPSPSLPASPSASMGAALAAAAPAAADSAAAATGGRSSPASAMPALLPPAGASSSMLIAPSSSPAGAAAATCSTLAAAGVAKGRSARRTAAANGASCATTNSALLPAPSVTCLATCPSLRPASAGRYSRSGAEKKVMLKLLPLLLAKTLLALRKPYVLVVVVTTGRDGVEKDDGAPLAVAKGLSGLRWCTMYC